MPGTVPCTVKAIRSKFRSLLTEILVNKPPFSFYKTCELMPTALFLPVEE